MQSRTNQVMIGGVLLVAVVAIASLVYFTAIKKPAYETLFANLSAGDAGAVTQKLKDDKVPYTLAQTPDGGTTIKVPVSNVYEERVKLAGDGTIKGGSTGYELFDKTNFGMTDFQEKIAKTRAIEGELQRTISSLSAVESARVHLATPDTSLYSSTQQPTTASVAIRMKRGSALSPEEIRGITLLVSGAVEGLKPENVTLINQDGTVMLPQTTADGKDPIVQAANAVKLTQDQLVAKQRYENNLQSSLQSMLDNTLGPKKAAVRVSTEMNFDANASESKTFSPQGTIRSEQTEREAYQGTQPPRNAPGVPGTTTNVVGTYQGLNTPQQQGRYARSKATRNFEISEATNKHIDAPGKVTRTSVAVLVNVPNPLAQPVTTGTGANAAAPVYAVNPADVRRIENVMKAAAGLDVARGDQISVEGIPFNPAVTGEGATRRYATPGVLGIPYWVLGLIAALLAIVGLGAYAASRRQKAFKPSGGMPSFDSTLAEELPPFEEHPMLDTAPGIAAPIRSAADLTREQMIEYVTTVAQENPDSIAKLIKLWMAE